MDMVDLRTYGQDAPSFTDRTGTVHTARVLSVIQEYALEKQYHEFLGKVIGGQLAADTQAFADAARPIIEAMGYPVDALLAAPAEGFWDVLNGFFQPQKKAKPVTTAPEPGAGASP